MPAPVRSILVIRFSSAGDIVLTSAALRALRRRHPDARIEYITRKEFVPLVAHSPHIDRVIAFERGWGTKELRALKQGMLRDNGGRYDIVLDLHNSLRSRLLRPGLGRQTGVYHKPVVARWMLVRWKMASGLRPITPVPLRYLMAGRACGLEDDGAGLELHIGDARTPVAPVTERGMVALAPGARHATKMWPAERFAALGRELQRMGARVLLVGGPEERELCGEIAETIGGDVANLAGQLSWLETAATLDLCDVVVANDSAITHIAAARGRPVVAVFGSTVQEFGFAPWRTRSAVVENVGLSCRPCTTIGRAECPLGHFRCMVEIGVEQVMEAVQSVWSPPTRGEGQGGDS